jgi:hypothetical protein
MYDMLWMELSGYSNVSDTQISLLGQITGETTVWSPPFATRLVRMVVS